MELTRRDVLGALSAAGVGSVSGSSGLLDEGAVGEGPTDDDPITDHDIETLVALAEVVYPSGVAEIESFTMDLAISAPPVKGSSFVLPSRSSFSIGSSRTR